VILQTLIVHVLVVVQGCVFMCESLKFEGGHGSTTILSIYEL